jgi:hypothetical protein
LKTHPAAVPPPSHGRAGRRRGRPGHAIAALLLAGCAAPVPAPDGRLHVAMDVAGRVDRRDIRLVAERSRVDGCFQPGRERLPTADRPAPAAHEPPNVVFGYAVNLGPRFLPGAMDLAPEWRPFGPQHHLLLHVLPRPDAAEGTGPVLLGRAFRIVVGTPEGRWERTIAEDDPVSAGRVRIAADGLSGDFHARGLVLQIPHNAMPDSESIAVAGTWRCPAPA